MQDENKKAEENREKTPEEITSEIIQAMKDAEKPAPPEAKKEKKADNQQNNAEAEKEASVVKSSDKKPSDAGVSSPAKETNKTSEEKKPEDPEKEIARKAVHFSAGGEKRNENTSKSAQKKSFTSLFTKAQNILKSKTGAKTDKTAASGKNTSENLKEKPLNEAVKNYISRLKTADYKKLLRDRQNVTVGLAGVALLLAVIALVRTGDGGADLDNAFIQANFETEKAITAAGNKTPAAQAPVQNSAQVSGNDTNSNLDPSKQKVKQLVIKDKDEFNHMVADAVKQIKLDEVKEALAQRKAKWQNADDVVQQGRRIYGSEKARFIMYEYSDIECPYCKNFFSVPKEVADLSNGQVALEWRHFPLDFHQPAAGREAIAAQCVYKLSGNRSFWVALERLFETTGSNGQGSSALNNLADEMGIDQGKYLQCINDANTQKEITDDQTKGANSGVASTPSLVIVDTKNGRTQLLTGAVPKEQIMQTIENMNAQGNSADEQTTDQPAQSGTNTESTASSTIKVSPEK